MRLSFYNQKGSIIIAENTNKYITFPLTAKKELNNCKLIKCKANFIHRFRIISRSLSNPVKCSSERLHRNKCTYCKSYLDYMSVKDDQLIFNDNNNNNNNDNDNNNSNNNKK